MIFDEEQQAEAIAADWGVDVALLQQASWTVSTIDGNDGEVYGYVVRFDDDDTPPEILTRLGIPFGQLERELSINAFDAIENGRFGAGRFGEGRYGGESFPLDQPFPDLDDEDYNDPGEAEDGIELDNVARGFPDLPDGQEYLTDDVGSVLTDEFGRGLIVDVPPASWVVGGATLNDHVLNGPTFAAASFDGSSFQTETETPGRADHVAALRSEMLGRLDDLEAVLRHNLSVAPNRGHNRPPELLEIEGSVTQEQFRQVVAAIDQVRRESESSSPNPENIAAQVSVFRRIARLFAIGTLWLGGAAATGIIGQEAGIAFTAHKQQIFDALAGAADSVSAWLQLITPTF